MANFEEIVEKECVYCESDKHGVDRGSWDIYRCVGCKTIHVDAHNHPIKYHIELMKKHGIYQPRKGRISNMVEYISAWFNGKVKA